jgi:glycosyltransferase involved in cell wall biosynthesis
MKQITGRIAYTGAFRFPEGGPAALRVLGIAKALRQEGYEVIMASGDQDGRPEDCNGNGEYTYQGFQYWPVGNLSRGNHAIQRLWQYLRGGYDISHWLAVQRRCGVDAIVAYEPGTPMLLALSRIAHFNRIPLILDIGEWPAGDHLPGGRFGARSMDKELRMRYLYPRVSHVIAVSSYLAQFYRSRGCKVIRVPPLVDLADPKWQTRSGEPYNPLRLVYAGDPGKKDLLKNIILGLKLVEKNNTFLQLHLIGVPKDRVAAMLGTSISSLSQACPALVFRDKVPPSYVPQILAGCHYSVLLRPQRRYAAAGFPTKLVESLSAGLPIITNLTSDIHEYVQDLQEGVIVAGDAPADFARALERAVAIPHDEYERMREKAKAKAALALDYRRYASAIGQFFAHSIGSTNPEAQI